jgi:hypothetical protein
MQDDGSTTAKEDFWCVLLIKEFQVNKYVLSAKMAIKYCSSLQNEILE